MNTTCILCIPNMAVLNSQGVNTKGRESALEQKSWPFIIVATKKTSPPCSMSIVPQGRSTCVCVLQENLDLFNMKGKSCPENRVAIFFLCHVYFDSLQFSLWRHSRNVAITREVSELFISSCKCFELRSSNYIDQTLWWTVCIYSIL